MINKDQLKVFFLYSDEKNERFIEHIINSSNFCISCGELCDDCRLPYKSHAGDISGIHPIFDELESFLDEPEIYLPKSMPPTDIVVVFNLHHDILAVLPEFLNEHGIKGLIVPVEGGDWVPLGLQRQIEDDLNEYGIQYAFPRPYCSLVPSGQPLIDYFIEYFRIGKPVIELNVFNGKIINGNVKISTPCGCAWYLVREIIRYKPPVDDILKEVISKGHHSYPCNADMKEDKALGDTTLHIAGYIHREIVYKAISENALAGEFNLIDNELEELKEKTGIIRS